ncbi:MAG: LysR family transcriptional regulator [Pseudomonadota bacterium]
MDLSRADLALLSSLKALLQEQGVTSAARRVGISQPAMSAQLARLRDLFDDPLLVGNAHGMVLTPVAKEILPQLTAGIDILTQVIRERVPFDAATSDRTFSIASTDYIYSAVLILALRALRDEAPGIRFAMSLLNDRDASADEMDLVVATPTFSDPATISQTLYSETFVLIMHKAHWAACKALSLDDFCALEHILVAPRSPSFVGPIDDVLFSMGRTRRVVASMPSFILALQAVQSTDLVAVFPKRLAVDSADRIAICTLPFDSPGFDVIATWHPKLQKDPGHVWFRTRLGELVKTGSAKVEKARR